MMKSTFLYVPKYILQDGSVVDMLRGGAQNIKSLGRHVFTFNPDCEKIGFIPLDDLTMSRDKIPNLRAVIYQTDESSQEFKDVKRLWKCT